MRFVIHEVPPLKLRTAKEDPHGAVVDGLLNKNGELESKTALKTAKEIDLAIEAYSLNQTAKERHTNEALRFWLEVRAEFKRTLKARRA